MAQWIPPFAGAGYRCAVNPEACVRAGVSAVDNSVRVVSKLNKFNQEMYHRANQGDMVAHSYMYPGCPYIPPQNVPSQTQAVPPPTSNGFTGGYGVQTGTRANGTPILEWVPPQFDLSQFKKSG
jgi:hypothetical protein